MVISGMSGVIHAWFGRGCAPGAAWPTGRSQVARRTAWVGSRRGRRAGRPGRGSTFFGLRGVDARC